MNDDDTKDESIESPEPAAETETDVDAFGKGVAEAGGKTEAPKVETPEVKASETPEAKTDPVADTVKPPEDEAKPEDAQKVATEAEIKSLNLKDKAAERFRELSARPTKEDVEKQIAPLRELADRATQMQNIINETGANAEQIGISFKYLKAINSGDPQLMNKAFDTMYAEVSALGKYLGRELPGMDPLPQDLKDQVEAGATSREAALELVRLRAANAQQAEVDKRRDQQQANERQTQEAVSGIDALGSKLKASDPHFAVKLEWLKPSLKLIRETLPPSKWVGAVERAYAELPNPAPAPVKAAVSPMRPGSSGAPMRAVPKNDLEAFQMGVDALKP